MTVLFSGHKLVSSQSGVPLLLASVSGMPQPQLPGAILLGSLGQLSSQSGVLSLSESVSTIPQPHNPASVLLGSLGQLSMMPLACVQKVVVEVAPKAPPVITIAPWLSVKENEPFP